MKQIFTILFDLDGTLVDTAPDLMSAHNHVMNKFGYPTKSTEEIRNLVEKICSLTGTDFDSLVEVSPDRLGKDQAYLLDSNKLRDSLDWNDKVDLNEGLIDTLNRDDKNLEI